MTASGWTGRTAALAVLLLAATGGCYKNHNNNTQILPLKASISIPNAPGAGPLVYLRVSSGDNPDDDIVPLDLVLRAGGTAVSFDAIDAEIHLENPAQPGVPAIGILQFIFDAGANQKTPFGPCGGNTTCTANGNCNGIGPACSAANPCSSGTCTFTNYSCDSAVSCDACLSCPADGSFTAMVTNPFCLSNLAGQNTDGVVILGAAGATSADSGTCPAMRTLPANNEIVLLRFGLLASAEGSVRVRFITNPAKLGDCEILLNVTDLGIPFDDGGAVFTAHR